MNDLIGLSQRSGDLYAVLRSHEVMLGRSLTIVNEFPEEVVNGIVLVVHPDPELSLGRKARWQAQLIEEIKLKVHSPDILQIVEEFDEIYDGLINTAFKRFRNVRHTLSPKGAKEVTEEASKKARQGTQERIRTAIFKQLMGNTDDRRASAMGLLAITARELEYCRAHQLTLAKRIEAAEAEVKSLADVPEEALREQMVDSAIGGVMKLLDSGAYVNIEFTLGCIEAVTGHIWLKHKGKFFYMGIYKIEVPYNGENVKVTPIQSPPGFTRGEYPHPHVNSTGGCCLGNIARAVPQYLKKGAYAALLSLLKEFLESYNSGNPYRQLEGWKSYDKQDLELVYPKGERPTEDPDDDDDDNDDEPEEDNEDNEEESESDDGADTAPPPRVPF